MKYLLSCVLILMCIVHNAYCAMSEAQIKSTTKLMRNSCQPKTKVTNAQIDAMHKGVWDGDRNAMCYMQCIFKMMKIVDEEGNFLVDVILSQVSNIPEPRREPTTNTAKTCDKGIKGADACESSYLIAKCFYEDNPSNYFFP